jgi:hypothetical protein
MNKKLFYVVFFCIITLCICFTLYSQTETFKAAVSNIKIKKLNHQEIKDEVLYTLKIIDKVFNKHKIWYIGAYGTLLGAIRHWDLIPWDDDGDLIVKRKDVGKILALKDEFKKYDIEMVDDWKIIKLYPNNLKYPFVDLFIHEDVDNKNVRCKRPFDMECNVPPKETGWNWWWKWVEFPSYWIRERKRLQFGYIKIWGPNEPVKLLQFWYGRDVLTTCMTPIYDHIQSKYIESKEIPCSDLPKPQI